MTFLFSDIEGSTRLWQNHSKSSRARSTRGCAVTPSRPSPPPGVWPDDLTPLALDRNELFAILVDLQQRHPAAGG